VDDEQWLCASFTKGKGLVMVLYLTLACVVLVLLVFWVFWIIDRLSGKGKK